MVMKKEDKKGPNIMDQVEAGIFLGGKGVPIAPHTLADWRTNKKGPPYLKVGRLVRYHEEDLLSWLKSCRVQPDMGPEGA
jgi:hypothetical protein